MSSKVVALPRPRTVTVHFLYQDEVRELPIPAKAHSYRTDPELLVVETVSGGFVEFPMAVVIQVQDDPA